MSFSFLFFSYLLTRSIFPRVNQYLAYSLDPLTDETIKTAVKSYYYDLDDSTGLITLWNTSNVTDISQLFKGFSKFNDDIHNWDVSNVTSMDYMFEDATLFDSDLSNWNVTNVTNMKGMFSGAETFTGNNLGKWDVSNVKSMAYMFRHSEAFQSNLHFWKVENVVNMRSMFAFAYKFNSDISKWNVSHVTDMNRMFAYTKIFNCDLKYWNISKVVSMKGMFHNAIYFNQELCWNISDDVDTNNMLFGSPSKIYDESICGITLSDKEPTTSKKNSSKSSSYMSLSTFVGTSLFIIMIAAVSFGFVFHILKGRSNGQNITHNRTTKSMDSRRDTSEHFVDIELS